MKLSPWLLPLLLCFAGDFSVSAQQGRTARQYRPYEGLDCTTPDGLRQVLCSRDDTSHMCRFFDAQTESAAFGLPSLGSGVTIFVMVDAAVSRVKYMTRSSALAQTIRALSSNEIPDAKWISMRMYLQLSEPMDREELVHHARVATVLSQALPQPNQYDLTFSQTGDGQVEITSLSRMSRARILDSFEVCGSWIHTVDGLILPSNDNSVEGIPAFRIPRSPAKHRPEADSTDSSSRTIAGGLLGGIAVLLGTLCFQGLWTRWPGPAQQQREDSLSIEGRRSYKSRSQAGSGQRGTSVTSSDDSDLTLQDSVDLAVGRALDKWAGERLAQNSLRRPSPQPQDVRRVTLADGRSPVSPSAAAFGPPRSSSLRGSDANLIRGSSQSAPQSPTPVGEMDQNAMPPPQPVSSELLTPRPRPVMEEPGRPPEASCSGYATSPEGPVSGRRLQEVLQTEVGCIAAPDESEEVTWESVQAVFDRVQDRSWQLEAEDLTICLRPDGQDWVLGSGGYGRVYKGILHGSTPVAIKFIARQTHTEKLRFVSEIDNLKNLRHVNITQFVGAHIAQSYIVLASEYMSRGDLWNALNKDGQRQFSWYNRGRQVALDIVCGLVFLHSKSMVHLDMKSSNILLSRDGTAKIADVGLARILTRANAKFSAEGTFEWAAPEVLLGQNCSEKADIFSLGVILWEIITGENPHLRSLRAFKVPEEVPADAGAVVEACRAVNPSMRPSARQLFQQLTSHHDSMDRPAFRSLAGTASLPSDASLSLDRRSDELSGDTGNPGSPSRAAAQPVTMDLRGSPHNFLNPVPGALRLHPEGEDGPQASPRSGGDAPR